MRKQNLWQRILSLIMTFVLVLTTNSVGNVGVVFAYEGPEEIHPQVRSASSFSLGVEWYDSEFKNGTAYDLQEDDSVTNSVKLTVSYSSQETREEGYAPGELIITVKGIGNVKRDAVLKALVGADEEGSNTKNREWSYTWNSANDTYTFTNNEAIEGNTVFSGYFELLWEVNARDSIHGYSQDDIQASLYLPDGTSLDSQVLSFSNETKADTFEVKIDEYEMYSYEGLTEGIDNPDEYVFICYDLSSIKNSNSRGLESSYYLFNPDSTGVGSGAIVISPNMNCSSVGNGDYQVDMSENGSSYIFVAYPKDSYTEKDITASIKHYGVYYEGDDSGDTNTLLLAEDSITRKIPADFHFANLSNENYRYSKDDWYHLNVSSSVIQARGGDLKGAKMVYGTEETFYLEGNINNPDGIAYTLEMVDDFLYIMKNNGTYRQLETGEYEFKSVTIPSTNFLKNLNDISIQADVYRVEVYAAKSGAIIDLNSSPAWAGVLGQSQQSVTLPDDTTAVAVVFVDVMESIKSFSIPVVVEFHINDTSDLAEVEQDKLTVGGRVVNTSFIKVYQGVDTDDDGVSDEKVWLNSKYTEDNYRDYTNLGLAAKDLESYGSYLERESADITFYDSEKNDYSAYTSVEPIKVDKNRHTSIVTMGADFQFEEDTHPNRFSLYTVLPEELQLDGYKLPEDIWDIMSLSGLGLNESELANACTPEVIVDYEGSGRTYIALHFQFEKDVEQSSSIKASFNVKVNEDTQNIYVRSAVIIDDSINEYSIRKVTDNGNWGDDQSLFRDIDRDGDADETLAYSIGYYRRPLYVASSEFQLIKQVKTSYTEGDWVADDTSLVEFGGIYQYKLTVKNGNSTSSNIVLMDILESASESQAKGTLQEVDLSEAEKLGITGTVYYSSSSDPSPSLDSDDWSTIKGDDVKAIAVDFGDAVLGADEELSVILVMKASEDVSLNGEASKNVCSTSLTMYDSITGNVTKQDNLESNLAQVQLTYPLKNIVVEKKDAKDGALLSGAVFALISKESGETVAEVTSNERGLAIFRNLPADGTTYIIREKTAPYGYDLAEDTEVTVNDDNIYVTVLNPRKTGRIEVYKVNNLASDVKVGDAEYTLYDEEKNVVMTAVTDADGMAVFNNVSWGSYTVKETLSPEGYLLNETEYPVMINRETVAETVIIDTADVQEDAMVHLVKYVKQVDGTETNEPLNGAIFELVRKTGSGDKRVGLYTTDKEGKIDIINLPYGDYYFREYRTPIGYEKADDVTFNLNPNNREEHITVYDQRKPGRIIIMKKDNLGTMLEGIEFSLYLDKDADPVARGTTDEYGVVEFDELEWGTYYVKETKAPDYYVMDAEWKEVIISANQLEEMVECINETVKGSVVLTKNDETGTILLDGAEYTLYDLEGTVLGTYTTDTNGQLKVENLEWGSYYFKETKAPEGYTLSDETIRFSVNALNAGVEQNISVVDVKDKKTLTLTKRIRAEDINFDNGNPTFIFKVEGTDVDGTEHTYYRIVTFDAAYVEANTDSEGYVTQSVTISNLTAGEYTAAEMDSSRYVLESISDVENGEVSGESVVFDLLTYKEGSALFTNKRYENQYFSDTQNLLNILKQRALLTAVKVSYGTTEVQANSAVDTSILKVTAYYDDGTMKELSASEYDLSINKFPEANGDYTVTVSKTEFGVTRSDTFTVTISGGKEKIVALEATVKDEYASVETGSKIEPDMFTVTAVRSDGTREILPSAGLSVEESPYTVDPEYVPNTDGPFEVTISLNLDVMSNNGEEVSTTVVIEAKTTKCGLYETGTDNLICTWSELVERGYITQAQDGMISKANSAIAGDLYISTSVTSIGNAAFRNCTGLTSVTIPNSVTSIVTDAFRNCTGLASVTIPNSVTSIGDCAFYNCSKLTSVTIPNSVTSIGTQAFRYCTKLTSVTIPDSVTSIKSYTFNYCSSLTSVTIPDSVTSIGSNAFQDCSKLTNVYYTGSEEQWAAISIQSNNTPLTNATIVYNYTP